MKRVVYWSPVTTAWVVLQGSATAWLMFRAWGWL